MICRYMPWPCLSNISAFYHDPMKRKSILTAPQQTTSSRRKKVGNGSILWKKLRASDGSGSKIFDPSWVGSSFSCSGRVSHLWFGYGFGKFTLKSSNFQLFALRVKKMSSGLGQFLAAQFGSGQPSLVWKKCHWVGIKKYPGQRRVGLFFTAGQKYARFRWGLISSWGRERINHHHL